MFSSAKTLDLRWTRTRRAAGVLVAGVAGLLWSAQSAQAADVYWSIGVHQPGVHVGVSNGPRVVYGPPPVVVYAPPVYRAGWAPPGHGKHWHNHHDRHRHWRDDDRRHDRYDRYGRDERWGDRDDRHERWDDRRDHRR